MNNGSRAVPLGLRVTLAISAIVLVVLGGGLVFATHWMSNLYGTTESIAGDNAARTAGAAIFALGILAWLGNRRDATALRNIVLPVMFTRFLLKSVVAYSAFAGHVFKAPVAMTVLFFDVALSVLYGYFLIAIWRKLRH
jgi:hypothetical protein